MKMISILRKIRNIIGKNVWKRVSTYAYMHYYYWHHTGKELDFKQPKDLNQKLLWLARYWQDPRIVTYADKLAVRDYIKQCGFEHILTKVYAEYASAEEINFSILPDQFVLKCNHCGGGVGMVICKEKATLDEAASRRVIDDGLHTVIGLDTCEYQYQYIKPRAYAEEFIGNDGDERYEIQFFCFNGQAKHILVRNDLGDAAQKPYAISYDINWTRVHDRKWEDMSINISRPKKLDEMLEIANKLAAPFPHVRVDLYLVNDEWIYFGEMTFSTSGNILWNYTPEVVQEWGEELVLPEKLNTKWRDVYESYVRR